MSYVSSFVQAQPTTTKIVITENKPAAQATTVGRKEATVKIFLFAAILACLALAIAI